MSDYTFTDKNPCFFYNPRDFSFLDPVIKNFKTIRKELLHLLSLQQENQWLGTFPSYVKSAEHKAWKAFTFIFFGMKFPRNAELCPATAKLVYSIPQILSCEFSLMKAGTRILPHTGYTRTVLRCHLPLIVPNEDLCGLRVGNETVRWKEGELLIFDDSFEHEAWNDSSKERVVLMFDIPNPLWGYSAHEISKYKIESLTDSFLLSLASKEQWLDAFNAGILPLNSFPRQ